MRCCLGDVFAPCLTVVADESHTRYAIGMRAILWLLPSPADMSSFVTSAVVARLHEMVWISSTYNYEILFDKISFAR